MEQLIVEVRRLVYTVICFQCLIQLTEGSVYRKYLRVFSYLLTMYICCNIAFSFVGQVESSLFEADELYDKWEKEWREMTDENTITSDINEGKIYYEEHLWEGRIIEGSWEEYDKKYSGSDVNGSEVNGQTAESD